MKPVTPKERQVLRLIAEGKSSKEIAVVMSISFHTVETHRRNLREKFEARNIAEVIMKAHQAMAFEAA